MEQDETPEAIEGLLKEGGALLVAGATGSYKSLFTELIALCKGADLPLLGQYEVSTAPTFILDSENLAVELKRRLKMIRRGLDIPITGSVFIVPKELHEPLYMDIPEDVDWLIDSLQGIERPMVVIDPLIDHFSGSENSTEDMAAFTRGITALIRATNATVIIVQHFGKETWPPKAAKDKPRGSSVLTAYVDSILNLSQKGEQLTATVSKCRYGPQGHSWVFDVQFSDEDELVLFEFVGEEERAESYQERVKEGVVAVLEQADKLMTFKEIRASVPTPRTPGQVVVRNALQELEEVGIVTHQGKRGSAYLYYLVSRTAELGVIDESIKVEKRAEQKLL